MEVRRRAARSVPYPEGRYDPASAAAYFNSRPFSVLGRATELLAAGVGFGSKLLLDSRTGNLEANASSRAAELTTLLTRLGPTFIKIGQALSIRADLLPPAYLSALTELQDSVPPFPTEVADQIIETELGQPIGQIFEDISREPIASASLGQVYRARLVDGPEVAVKVQRPGMNELVALDLHLLRVSAGPVKQVLSVIAPVSQDLVGLIDAWGTGFVGELDYEEEALNAQRFMDDLAKTPLKEAVCAPAALQEYTTKRVLTSEWVLGTRLEESDASDVSKLCSVAMNTYLTMLFETGVLHADPHPGNLLRTPDGRLCILDWGLVTRVERNTQITMIEHLANLVSREYDNLPNELVMLGFVPEGKEEAIAKSEVVTVLSAVYNEWTDGGGAATVDVNKFLSQLQALGGKYGNIFRVPPYFFYIARAFVVLEGIGLLNNSRYSIISECLPYVSRRLLSDPSPRVAGALATFVYGKQKDAANRQLSTEKVDNLASGFSSYMSATGGLMEVPSPADQAGSLVDQMAAMLVDDGESDLPTPLQEIVIEELAKVLGANARQSFASLGFFERPQAEAQEDPQWSVVAPDAADQRTLATAEQIAAIARPQVQKYIDSFRTFSPEERVRIAGEVLSKLWDYRAGAARTSGRVAAKLFSQGLRRLSRDLTLAGKN